MNYFYFQELLKTVYIDDGLSYLCDLDCNSGKGKKQQSVKIVVVLLAQRLVKNLRFILHLANKRRRLFKIEFGTFNRVPVF